MVGHVVLSLPGTLGTIGGAVDTVCGGSHDFVVYCSSKFVQEVGCGTVYQKFNQEKNEGENYDGRLGTWRKGDR